MNPENRMPDDSSEHRPIGPDAQRKAETERLLRLAHPVPPQFDLAAIERLARGVALAADAPGSIDHRPAREQVSPQRDYARAHRRYTMTAGAWVCGVVVGAVAMFLYQGRAIPSIAPARPSGVAVQDLGDVASRPGAAPRADSPVLESNSVQAVASRETVRRARDESWLPDVESFDLFTDVGPRGRATATMWSIGMCLVGGAAASEPGGAWADAADPAMQSDSPNSRANPPRETERDSDPKPPSTRSQLLRDLMNEHMQGEGTWRVLAG